jgi:GMP synthase-like glutamine amidotransferase
MSIRRRIAILTHIECEGPGLWGEFFAECGIPTQRFRVNDGDGFPADDAFDALLILGGPMNVDQHDRYPWIVQEKAFIRRAIDDAKPVVGVCLGAQLIARALGASVMKNPVKEIGWDAVSLTSDGQSDPVFRGFPALSPIFQWHGDTFDIPEGATLLASSTRCAHQAFRYADRTYAFQFHVEMTPDIIAECVRLHTREVERGLPKGAGDRIIAQAHDTAHDFHTISRRLFDNIVDVCEIA